MKQPPVKQHWITKCIEIHNFHVSQVKSEPGWTVDKTCKALNRSMGSVCEDLMIASWLKTHEKQIKRFRNRIDALEFIRGKKKEMKTQELDI